MSDKTKKPEAEPQGGPCATPKPRRKLDPEVQAMARIDAILADLDPPSASRVALWANSKAGQRLDEHYDQIDAEPELLT